MTVSRDDHAVVALTTVANEETAKALALALVSERLAACVHILPKGISVYWWENKIEAMEEWTLVIKTEVVLVDKIDAFFSENHSYAVPELLVLPVAAGNEAYFSWMKDILAVRHASPKDSPDPV